MKCSLKRRNFISIKQVVLVLFMTTIVVVSTAQANKTNNDDQYKQYALNLENQMNQETEIPKDFASDMGINEKTIRKEYHPLIVEQYRPFVAQYFPTEEIENALTIMEHESGGDTNAVSATNDHGLMQIHAPLWTNYFGVTTEDLKDPETNIRLGSVIWRRGSWNTWTTHIYL